MIPTTELDVFLERTHQDRGLPRIWPTPYPFKTLRFPAPIHNDRASPANAELFTVLGDLENVRAVHFFGAEMPGEVEEIYVAVDHTDLDTIRAVTDAVTDVELEFDRIYEIRVVGSEEKIPIGARIRLVKEP